MTAVVDTTTDHLMLFCVIVKKTTPASIVAIAWISLILPPLSATASAANSASFIKIDSTTMGSWIGAYGADGYYVTQDGSTKKPSYASVTFSGQRNWTWAASTTQLPASLKAAGA